MPLSRKQSRDRTVCCLLSLTPILFFSAIAGAQSSGSRHSDIPSDARHDSTRAPKPPHYFSCAVLTGGAVQFFPKKSGLFAVSFPYTSTDAAGTSTLGTFSAQQRNVFGSADVLVGPLAFEAAGLNNFVRCELSFLLGKGESAPGWKAYIGYGRIWSIGHYAIKFSLNVSVTSECRQGGDVLGTINSQDKTLEILGWEPSGSFYWSNFQTISTTSVKITYSQREWSFLPEISLLPDPYLTPNHLELTLGYTLPVHDFGGINFVEQGASTSEGAVSHLDPGPSILSPGIAASYNNQPLHAPLYRFGGFYLELRYDVIDWKKKKKKRA